MINADDNLMPICLSASVSVCLLALIFECLSDVRPWGRACEFCYRSVLHFLSTSSYLLMDSWGGGHRGMHNVLQKSVTFLIDLLHVLNVLFGARGTILELLGRSGPPLEHHGGTEGHPSRRFTDSRSILEASVVPKASPSDP